MQILLMYCPSSSHLAALRQAAPQAQIKIVTDEKTAKQKIQRADAVLGNRYFIQSLPFAENLRWMQSNSAGLDLILSSPFAHKPFQLTSVRGVYDEEVAEHTLALLCALARKIPYFRDAQKKQIWNPVSLLPIGGSRCLILGCGSIGQTIGRKLRSLGAFVEGVGRRSDPSWQNSLRKTDFLISALPLTPFTRQFVSRTILEKLPPHAFFINVGRGKTVDEEALLERIGLSALAGAALDVLAEEPLPESHPFWQEENILITPHVARSPEMTPYRWEALFVENLRRFSEEEPLLNLVNKEIGY